MNNDINKLNNHNIINNYDSLQIPNDNQLIINDDINDNDNSIDTI